MKEIIKDFIIKNFMFGKGSLSDDDSLFKSGIMDSLSFVKLIIFIEKRFNVSFNMRELTLDNFDTIKKIANAIVKMKK